jgi:hypothetical protein
MRCSRVERLLPAYLDGDLSSRLNESVAEHLDLCDGCRLAQSAQQSAHRFLDTGRYVPSIDLWADFSRRLQQETRPRASMWRFLYQPGLAGALAAAVVSLVMLSSPPLPSAARWQTAPSPAVQMARTLEPSDLEPSPAALPVAPRQPRLTPPVPLVDEELDARAGAEVSDKPGTPPSVSRRFRQPVRVRAGITLLAKSSVSARLRPGPRFHIPDRVAESPARRVAAKPPATSGSGGLKRDASSTYEVAAAGPVDVAQALMTVQQDAASSQMQDELLMIARQVARVSGDLPSNPITPESAGT